jgi:hypothetical protein
MSNPQKVAMDAYLKEMADLVAQRQALSKRISGLEKALRGMIDLLGTDEEQMEYMEKLDELVPPVGLSDAIEQALGKEDGDPLLPTEIRDRVIGYLGNHSNQMASVHTTLKRLVKRNPFIETVQKDGKTAYRWVSMGERMVRDIQLRAAAEEMRKAGSEIGTPPSLDSSAEKLMRQALGRKKK